VTICLHKNLASLCRNMFDPVRFETARVIPLSSTSRSNSSVLVHQSSLPAESILWLESAFVIDKYDRSALEYS
jgi:hypothetical protein